MADFTYEQAELEETEDVLGVFYGKRGEVGGQLIVTNRRLLLGPLDVNLAQTITLGGLGQVGVPGTDLLTSLLDAYAPLAKKQVWLRHITAVEPRHGGLLPQPGLRITTATGETIDFKVAKAPTSFIWSRENTVARDEAIILIRAAIKKAKGVRETGDPPSS